MSEFGGSRKQENNQHALVPPKAKCGCPSGAGIKNGHIRYASYGGTQKKRGKKKKYIYIDCTDHSTMPSAICAAQEKRMCCY